MKKTGLGLLLLMFTFISYAQEMSCLDKLLPYSRFSGLHTMTKAEWYDGKEALDAESARQAVTFLINSKLLCKPNEVVIKIEPVCQSLIADISQSNSCFVFTNVGHFLMNRDSGRNTNLIFSKDKKYSDQMD